MPQEKLSKKQAKKERAEEEKNGMEKQIAEALKMFQVQMQLQQVQWGGVSPATRLAWPLLRLPRRRPFGPSAAIALKPTPPPHPPRGCSWCREPGCPLLHSPSDCGASAPFPHAQAQLQSSQSTAAAAAAPGSRSTQLAVAGSGGATSSSMPPRVPAASNPPPTNFAGALVAQVR